MDFEQVMLEGLKNIKLMVEEEVDITILAEHRGSALSDGSLSLFGRFLDTNPFNHKVVRDALRLVWRMGADLCIL
jgi:hypothetical protein